MNLFEIFRDIKADADINKRRIEEDRANLDPVYSLSRHYRRSADGWFPMFVPHILGFIVGLALTKFMGLDGASFLVIGGICAFIAGTYKSIAFDKISFVPAVVRNIILMVLLTTAVAVIQLIHSTDE